MTKLNIRNGSQWKVFNTVLHVGTIVNLGHEFEVFNGLAICNSQWMTVGKTGERLSTLLPLSRLSKQILVLTE